MIGPYGITVGPYGVAILPGFAGKAATSAYERMTLEAAPAVKLERFVPPPSATPALDANRQVRAEGRHSPVHSDQFWR